MRLGILIACLAAISLVAEAEPPEDAVADSYLERARQASTNFAESLPKFVCQQVTTRYRKNAKDSPWQQQDVISAQVIYDPKTGETDPVVLMANI